MISGQLCWLDVLSNHLMLENTEANVRVTRPQDIQVPAPLRLAARSARMSGSIPISQSLELPIRTHQ
jgi:hypothetical protein